MRVATVLSMLTTVLPSKQVRQRVWAYCRARVGWTMAAFHLFASLGPGNCRREHGAAVHCRVQSLRD